MTKWKSDADENLKWPIVKTDLRPTQFERMVVGDWIKLTKGKPTEIEILLGERPGGDCYFQLLIQQKGVEYKQVPFNCLFHYAKTPISGTRPILPVFKTREIPPEMHKKIKIAPNVATLDGPTFGVLK